MFNPVTVVTYMLANALFNKKKRPAINVVIVNHPSELKSNLHY